MGEIAPEEQFLPLSTIFLYLMLDFYVKTGIRFSLRDKLLFKITEVEITRVDCTHYMKNGHTSVVIAVHSMLCSKLTKYFNKSHYKFHVYLNNV